MSFGLDRQQGLQDEKGDRELPFHQLQEAFAEALIVGLQDWGSCLVGEWAPVVL